MDHITANELAGFGVGTLLLCATIAAPKVDAFIAFQQRSSLGMCKRCGNLGMITCSKCKGLGFVREGESFGSTLLGDLYQSFGAGDSKLRSIGCKHCQTRGHFSCPSCSKASPV